MIEILTYIKNDQIMFLAFTLASVTSTAMPTHGVRHRHLHHKRATFGLHARLTSNSKSAYANNGYLTDGIAGSDSYTYYSGGPGNFPSSSQWMSFDAMFEANRALMRGSCGWNGWGIDNTYGLPFLLSSTLSCVCFVSIAAAGRLYAFC